MLDQERRRRLEELFDDAADLTPEQRAVMLDEECGDDDELRSELEILFRHDELMTGDFLKTPPETFPTFPRPAGGRPGRRGQVPTPAGAG